MPDAISQKKIILALHGASHSLHTTFWLRSQKASTAFLRKNSRQFLDILMFLPVLTSFPQKKLQKRPIFGRRAEVSMFYKQNFYIMARLAN